MAASLKYELCYSLWHVPKTLATAATVGVSVVTNGLVVNSAAELSEK